MRATSAEARAEGVERGMRRREAEARCPGVVCVDVDEANEARTFEVVARAIEAFTPRVVLDRPGRCDFLTRGPARYFGGDEPLAQKVRDAVAETLGPDGTDVRVGIADGVFAARLAARRRHVVPPGESAAFLAPWPVSTLGDDELASLLTRLGLHTLGAIAALAPDAVLARFGDDGRVFHELAAGSIPVRRSWSHRRPISSSTSSWILRPNASTSRRSRPRSSPTGCPRVLPSAGSRARA